MDHMLYSHLAQARVKELTSPSKEVEPFFKPFRPNWRRQLADSFYTLASKLEPKRYTQQMKLGRN